jgi:hypothetical protein
MLCRRHILPFPWQCQLDAMFKKPQPPESPFGMTWPAFISLVIVVTGLYIARYGINISFP